MTTQTLPRSVKVFLHDCTDSETPCPFQNPVIAEFECEPGWYWQGDGGWGGPFEDEAEAAEDACANL